MLAGGLLVWNIKDVQDASSGRFGSRGLSRVVRYMVSIDDVVIPVSLGGRECGFLESEGALPGARLG